MNRVVTAALACVLAGGVALAAPASAASHPRTSAGLHPTVPVAAASSAQPNLGVTSYGAGYFAYPGGDAGLASASATFVMPAISCVRGTDFEWLLPGIWVYDGSGTLTQQVDVNFNCNNGAKTQEVVVCITGVACDQSLQIAAHDKIVASIAYTASATVGTLRDLTAGTSVRVSGGPVTTDYTVFIGDAGPTQFGVHLVPKFTTVPFTSAQVNGEYVAYAPGVTGYDLQTASAVQISTSAIGVGGQNFTTTFVHPA